jgi:23S rRNA (pseudouridine1915-N3)-methyltransferase
MKTRIVSIGKLKESYYTQAQAEYIKMLRRFCDVEIVEVPDLPLEGVKGEKQAEAVRVAEGEKALQKCAGFVMACDMRGKKLTSEGFAEAIGRAMQRHSTITFVTGGSSGLSAKLLDSADMAVSFTYTMPHRLLG